MQQLEDTAVLLTGTADVSDSSRAHLATPTTTITTTHPPRTTPIQSLHVTCRSIPHALTSPKLTLSTHAILPLTRCIDTDPYKLIPHPHSISPLTPFALSYHPVSADHFFRRSNRCHLAAPRYSGGDYILRSTREQPRSLLKSLKLVAASTAEACNNGGIDCRSLTPWWQRKRATYCPTNG